MLSENNFNIQKVKVSALRKEYSLKTEGNGSYSLRAFARDLGVSHTLLNLIFKGERKVTDAFSKKALESISLSQESKEAMALGLKKNLTPEEKFQKLSLSQASMMSDWVHYAILSLTEIEGFNWDHKWIASRLGIPPLKAATAMKRLEELNVLVTDEFGKMKQKSVKIVVDNNTAFDAGKKFNRGLMKKAIQSMDNCQFMHRDLSSTTFTLDPKYIPYAVSEIKKFRRKLSEDLETMGEQSEVYAITVQLFPLSDVEKKS